MMVRATQGSAIVLIADGDLERAKRLEEVCAARGWTPRRCPHGAAALELALAEVPHLVVAPRDLPLIDARKLAEILRSNPRTQGVRFLFLGQPPGSSVSPLGEETLALPADATEVAARIEAILAQQARLHAMDRGDGEDREVEGKLSQIPLPDLLQLFHLNRRTGTLELTRRDGEGREEHARIHLRDGDVIQARVGAVEAEKALFRLLAWRSGSFAFSQNRGALPPRIHTPTRALLMEGMRQLDEAERLRASLPPADAQVALRVKTSELPNVVHPLTQEVLLLLEIYSRVQDVVDRCSYPDYQVLRTLHTLVERGLVQLRRGPAAAAPSGAPGLFSAAQARRLREWLDAQATRGAGELDAKLLVVAADAVATHDFVRLLRGLPGATIEGEFARGRFGKDDLARIGRLPVDGEVGIELVHVPVSPRCAPLWPLAGHGALGSLFLLSGNVSEAARHLEAPSAALRALPRARSFHVMLLRKDERSAPEEIQENLSLLDESSLFLVPLESGRDPRALLRALFSRILP